MQFLLSVLLLVVMNCFLAVRFSQLHCFCKIKHHLSLVLYHPDN